jgi:GAF domain-containing protein
MSQPGSGREQLLSRAFVRLADTLVDEYDIIDVLDQLVSYCVELLAADAAGILLADSRGTLRVVASSSEDAKLMELLQLQADEGPCMECFHNRSPVRVADLADATSRWPSFVAAVAQRGAFRSVHALPLRLRGEAIGAMNLFHHQPGPLPEADLALGQALADVATIGILSERSIRRGEVLSEQLQTALTHRAIIEQAKGVLAQHGGLSMHAAFDRAATPATATSGCPRWPARSSRAIWART